MILKNQDNQAVSVLNQAVSVLNQAVSVLNSFKTDLLLVVFTFSFNC